MSTDTTSRRDTLSAGKRALLERMLAGRGEREPRAEILPRGDRQGPAPLSFAQQRLWFLHQIDPASAAYNVPCALRLRGPLDRARLARCLAEIVRRHASLRTRFETTPGGPIQIVEQDARLELAVSDFAEPAPGDDAAILHLASQEASTSFDLTRAPLLRARLVRLGPEDHLFLLTMHHIVSDGWSMGVIVRELAALYEAFAEERPSPLPDLPIQYADFARWQRDRLRGEKLDSELEYWRQRLTPLPPVLDLPADRPRPAVQTFRGGMQPVRLDAEVA